MIFGFLPATKHAGQWVIIWYFTVFAWRAMGHNKLFWRRLDGREVWVLVVTNCKSEVRCDLLGHWETPLPQSGPMLNLPGHRRSIGPLHTGSFFARTLTKMIRSFWSRPGFGDGLGYLQFEYEANLTMVFWEKSKKPPKMGFLGPFQAQVLKSRVIWESFIIKQPPKIIFWDILHHKKPTGAH